MREQIRILNKELSVLMKKELSDWPENDREVELVRKLNKVILKLLEINEIHDEPAKEEK